MSTINKLLHPIILLHLILLPLLHNASNQAIYLDPSSGPRQRHNVPQPRKDDLHDRLAGDQRLKPALRFREQLRISKNLFGAELVEYEGVRKGENLAKGVKHADGALAVV